MNYKVVDKIPEKNYCYHDLRALLDEFASLNARYIEIDPIKEGYANLKSFQSGISDAIRKYGYKGRMRTTNVDDKVYLIKIDILEGNHD